MEVFAGLALRLEKLPGLASLNPVGGTSLKPPKLSPGGADNDQ
jgi:hypothetical protein